MPRYTEVEAREAVAGARSYSEALRRLGLRPVGGNHRLFRKWVDEVWKIPTDHFDPKAVTAANLEAARPGGARPLEEILVPKSTYQRDKLKRRLYRAGLKRPICELCGQDENWRGRVMAMILDHVNGVPDDNRLENLRIVCPNCAATLDTHCGRKNLQPPAFTNCEDCGEVFVRRRTGHRFCSVQCAAKARVDTGYGRPRPDRRRVARPPEEQLLAEIEELGWSGTGRKYGVSDNAIRKWVVWYERERKRREGQRADEAA